MSSSQVEHILYSRYGASLSRLVGDLCASCSKLSPLSFSFFLTLGSRFKVAVKQNTCCETNGLTCRAIVANHLASREICPILVYIPRKFVAFFLPAQEQRLQKSLPTSVRRLKSSSEKRKSSFSRKKSKQETKLKNG